MDAERNIVHERGDYWVWRGVPERQYTVYRHDGTHAVADSSYPLDDDGKSLAIARCNYLGQRP